MNRTDVDAIVALAGGLCLLVGSLYAFGIGGGLILLGIMLFACSLMKFTTSIILSPAQQKVARSCFPNVDEEEAYKLYASNLLTLMAEGKIATPHVPLVMNIKRLYSTYVVNFQSSSKQFKTILRIAYQRFQAIRMR